MRISDWSSDVCSSDLFVRLRSGSRHQHAELQEPPARQPTGSAQLRSSCRLWGAGSGTQIPFGKYGAAGQSPWVKDIGAVMTLPAAVIMGLATQCAPSVAPATIAAIVQTESQGFTWAIKVNGIGRKIVPTSREQAVALARHYIGKGHSVHLGLAQLNSRTMKALGLPWDNLYLQ